MTLSKGYLGGEKTVRGRRHVVEISHLHRAFPLQEGNAKEGRPQGQAEPATAQASQRNRHTWEKKDLKALKPESGYSEAGGMCCSQQAGT